MRQLPKSDSKTVVEKILTGFPLVTSQISAEINTVDPVMQLRPLEVAVLQNDEPNTLYVLNAGASLEILADKYLPNYFFGISEGVIDNLDIYQAHLLTKYDDGRKSLTNVQAAWLFLSYGKEPNVQKALTLRNDAKTDNEKGKISLFIGGHYFAAWKKKSDPALKKLALEYLNTAHSLLEKTNEKVNFVLVNLFLGELHFKDEIKEANKYFDNAVQNCANIPWLLSLVYYHAALGLLEEHKQNGDYNKAFALLLKATAHEGKISTLKLTVQKFYEAKCYQLLANIFYMRAYAATENETVQKYLSQAASNYEKSLDKLLELFRPNSAGFKDKILAEITPWFFTADKFKAKTFEEDIQTLATIKSTIATEINKNRINRTEINKYFFLFSSFIVKHCLAQHQTQIKQFYELYSYFISTINFFTPKEQEFKNLLNQKMLPSPQLAEVEIPIMQLILEHMYQVAITSAGHKLYGNFIRQTSGTEISYYLEYKHNLNTKFGFYYEPDVALKTYLQSIYGFVTEKLEIKEHSKEEQVGFIYNNYKSAIALTLQEKPHWLGTEEEKLISFMKMDFELAPLLKEWHAMFFKLILGVIPGNAEHSLYARVEKYLILYEAVYNLITTTKDYSKLFKKTDFPIFKTIPAEDQPTNLISAIVLQMFWQVSKSNSLSWSVIEFLKLNKQLQNAFKDQLKQYATSVHYRNILNTVNVTCEITIMNKNLKFNFKQTAHAETFAAIFSKKLTVTNTKDPTEVIIINYREIPRKQLKKIGGAFQNVILRSVSYQPANIKVVAEEIKLPSKQVAVEIGEKVKKGKKVKKASTKWDYFKDETDIEEFPPDNSPEINETKAETKENVAPAIVDTQQQPLPLKEVTVIVNNPNSFFVKPHPGWVNSWKLSQDEIERINKDNKDLLEDIQKDLKILDVKAKALKINYRSVLMYLIKIAVKLADIKFNTSQPPFAIGEQITLWRNILCDRIDTFIKKEKYGEAALEVTDYIADYVNKLTKKENSHDGFFIMDLKTHPIFRKFTLNKSKELIEDPAACLTTILGEIDHIREFISVDDVAGSMVIIGEIARILRDHHNKFCQNNFNSKLVTFSYSDEIKNKLEDWNINLSSDSPLLDQVDENVISDLFNKNQIFKASDVLLLLLEFRNKVSHHKNFVVQNHNIWINSIKNNLEVVESAISNTFNYSFKK